MPGESVDLSVPRVVKDPVVVHDSRIHINAPAKLVFSILIGINDYPTWNPLFKAITGAKDGVLKIGLPITLWIRIPGTPLSIPCGPLRVHELTPPDSDATTYYVRWGLNLGFFFVADHYFIVRDDGRGGCWFRQGEDLKGVVAYMMRWSSVFMNHTAIYTALDIKLKERAENMMKVD